MGAAAEAVIKALTSVDSKRGCFLVVERAKTDELVAPALEFDGSGRLIAGGADGVLYEIDPVDGVATALGPLINADKLSGLSLRGGGCSK